MVQWCVIRYIENEGKRFTTFVVNRIASIREQSRHYVKMALNPADDASRGMAMNANIKKKSLDKRPRFLLAQ